MKFSSNDRSGNSYQWMYSRGRILPVVCIMGLVVISIVGYGFYMAARINAQYAPWLDSAHEMRFEATTAYLWFEEILGSEKNMNMEVVWKHMSQAGWHASALLAGGNQHGGPVMPIDDVEIRQSLIELEELLAGLKDIAKKRLAQKTISGPGTKIDEHHHALLEHFINQTKEIETKLQRALAHDLRSTKFIQYVVIATFFSLFLLFGFVLNRFDRGREQDFVKISESKERLEKHIIEHKRREDTLRESETKLRLIAENIGDVFWLSTPGFRQMIYVSPVYEKIWGHNRDNLYQAPLSFIRHIHPDDLDQVLAGVKKLENGELKFEYRIIRPDGSIRSIENRIFPVKDELGNLYRLAGVARDITAMKLTEKRLIHIETVKSMKYLSSSIAHEINNSNGVISFNIPILREYLQELIPIIDAFAGDHQDFEVLDTPYSEFRKDILLLLDNLEHSSNRVSQIVSKLTAFSGTSNQVDLNEIKLSNVIAKLASNSLDGNK